jgi:hypothetical protein
MGEMEMFVETQDFASLRATLFRSLCLRSVPITFPGANRILNAHQLANRVDNIRFSLSVFETIDY